MARLADLLAPQSSLIVVMHMMVRSSMRPIRYMISTTGTTTTMPLTCYDGPQSLNASVN